MTAIETGRREVILGPMLALAALSLGVGPSRAAGVDPAMTIVRRPDEIPGSRSTISRSVWRTRPRCLEP